MSKSNEDQPGNIEKNSYPEDSAEATSFILNKHGGYLYSLGLKFCGSTSEAEDLVQETMLQVFRNWDSFRFDSKVRTWLYTIAARVCQRMKRKKSGEPSQMESLELLLPLGESSFAKTKDEISNQELDALKKRSIEKIEDGISRLPLDFRMPLVLKDIVGLSLAEISKIMEMELGTVKSRIHRARLRLRKIVDSELPRMESVPPAVQYPIQVCIDLLNAKQSAIDNNVPFATEVICLRCQSVFDSLDVTYDICLMLAEDHIPKGLQEKILRSISKE